jgi:phage terminase large subunit GpA-like protein
MTDSIHETVVVKKSSRIGYSELENNAIGYFIDQDPSSILLVEPTIDMARDWSKDHFSIMVRNTPCLKFKVKETKSRNGDNTILYKRYPGGHLNIAGANSPASLSARTARVVCFDEVGRFPASAGKEGNPVSLGKKRAATFWNRKYLEGSSPGIEGSCQITDEYETSDMRQYWVPCPECRQLHLLEWKFIVWEKDADGNHVPESAVHVCPHCGAVETDADLPLMLAGGKWIPQRPEVKNCAGFHINELYSPWVRFSDTVGNFLKSKDDPEKLKVWVNTALGETWKEAKEISTSQELMDRRENYTAELVPMGGVVITVGVDVQDDRLECETVAWGTQNESWALEHKIFPGDPNESLVWDTLDTYQKKTFRHETGAFLRIMGVGIDTGGHCTKAVYDYCTRRWASNIFALKGRQGQGKPFVTRPKKKLHGGMNLYHIGVDTAKDVFAANLVKTDPGPGYCHFPSGYDKAYFEQYLAERPKVKFSRGQRIRSWELKKAGSRNEALDMRIYSMSALTILGIDLNETVKQFLDKMQGRKVEAPVGRQNRMRILHKGVAA